MSENQRLLGTANHDRDAAGLSYIYPVISRRAGGVSVGVNLNPNNACNWHCAYCQVPELSRGVAPEIDVSLLDGELRDFLHDVIDGDFMSRRVPEGCRRLCDIAISGNGEPTSSGQFGEIVAVIGSVMHDFDLVGRIPLVLISNGSYAHRRHVQDGLKQIAVLGGEAWLKVDSATDAGIKRINGVNLSPARLRAQVRACAEACPTWIQTCVTAWNGAPPSEAEQQAYVRFLTELMVDGVALKGVRLYGLARPSLQNESVHIGKLSESWMQAFATRIEITGLPVLLTP
ncbi:MAG: radical SAM protein [Mariprofundaceae bacterium]